MKKIDNILHGVKTATLIAGLSLTMNSCSDADKAAEKQKETMVVSRKTDSILAQNPMYRLSCSINEISRMYLAEYKRENKDLVRVNAIRYLPKVVNDAEIRNMMLKILQQDFSADLYCDVAEIYENVCVDEKVKCDIRTNYRWFNNVLLYLCGKYTEDQFLKTDFFKLINNERAYNTFKNNAESIKTFSEILKASDKQMNSLHDKAWNQSVQEYRKEKQR